jgi:hypothetical protein
MVAYHVQQFQFLLSHLRCKIFLPTYGEVKISLFENAVWKIKNKCILKSSSTCDQLLLPKYAKFLWSTHFDYYYAWKVKNKGAALYIIRISDGVVSQVNLVKLCPNFEFFLINPEAEIDDFLVTAR